MAVMSGENLNLTLEQRFVLNALGALSFGLRSLPTVGAMELGIVMAPVLLQAISAVMQGAECPFSQPPSTIVPDYDSGKNMYQHCNHNPRHCWSLDGTFRSCP